MRPVSSVAILLQLPHLPLPSPVSLISGVRRIRRSSLPLALVLLSFLLPSCDKMPMNGDLDGMWQLTSITTPDSTRDTRSQAVYMSIQLHLVQWNNVQRGRQFFSHFTHTADSLLFYDFVHPSKYAVDNNKDEWITPAEMHEGLFDAWGIHATDARYRIRHLDPHNLTLESADTTLTFRKF